MVCSTWVCVPIWVKGCVKSNRHWRHWGLRGKIRRLIILVKSMLAIKGYVTTFPTQLALLSTIVAYGPILSTTTIWIWEAKSRIAIERLMLTSVVLKSVPVWVGWWFEKYAFRFPPLFHFLNMSCVATLLEPEFESSSLVCFSILASWANRTDSISSIV